MNLALVVRHSSAREENVIQQYFHEGPKDKRVKYKGNVFQMGCKPGQGPSWESQRWVIVITVGSHPIHVEQRFKVTEIYRERPIGKKREVQMFRPILRLSAGRTFANEFTTAKTHGSGIIGLLRRIKKQAYKFQCTFVAISGTPWNKSPSDMSGVISVLQHLYKDAWSEHETLIFGLPKNFNDVIKAYNNMAKGSSTISSAIPWFKEKRDELIIFLPDIMIMRTETSR